MDHETLMNRLGELNVNAKCPSCDTYPKWHGLGAVDTETILLHSIRPQGRAKLGEGFGVVGVVCGACGFVRLHALDVIAPGESSGVSTVQLH
jgi:hypothetical protein